MSYPNFHFEQSVWKEGYKFVAGVDEVGRGALAGPVVAGCVVFERNFSKNKNSIFATQKLNGIKIDDSKKLSAKQREEASNWIKENALTWGIGEASAREIDKLGIVKATNRAMRRAIGNANQRLHDPIQFLLIDAFYLPYAKGIPRPVKRKRRHKVNEKWRSNLSSGLQKAIVKGDEKSYSIAAASIVAKVYRDDLMVKLGRKNKYRKYAWGKNVGYGTRSHRDAIKKLGINVYHRRSFCKIIG